LCPNALSTGAADACWGAARKRKNLWKKLWKVKATAWAVL
jgi:hypothetical protein